MNTHDAFLRWCYRGGRPNRLAAALNRIGAILWSSGLWPSRMATLEVRGRRSGRLLSFPMVLAGHEGERYVVAMLGEGTNWVANVDRRAPLAEFERIADRYPVFRIRSENGAIAG